MDTMDWRRFARHLEFSSESGNRCWDTQRPALKLKVDTSNTFCNLQEAVTRRPRFRTPSFIKPFLLYCGLNFPFAVLSVQFSYALYNVDLEGTIRFRLSVTELRFSFHLPSTLVKTALLWVITQPVLVIPYRRFGTTYLSHSQGSRFLNAQDRTDRWSRNVVK
jgi:hypothetical protein